MVWAADQASNTNMATQVLRGTNEPQVQNEGYNYDPSRGWIHNLDFYGQGATEIANLQTYYAAMGMAAQLVYLQGGNARLDVSDATISTINGISGLTDVWQIVGNEESRDGLSHPALILALGSTASNVIAAMRKALAEDITTTDAFATGGPLHGVANSATVQRFYELQTRGLTEYRHGQYVLRHTTNAPNRWGQNVADYGIDCIYTTAELLSECEDGGLWTYPIPGRLAFKIGNIVSPVYQSGYLFGWLKGASTETTEVNNRVSITTEFILEQWSTDYYIPY